LPRLRKAGNAGLHDLLHRLADRDVNRPLLPIDPVVTVELLLLVRAEAFEVGACVCLQPRAGRIDAQAAVGVGL
jgi:hypothetical protein